MRSSKLRKLLVSINTNVVYLTFLAKAVEYLRQNWRLKCLYLYFPCYVVWKDYTLPLLLSPYEGHSNLILENA